MKVTSSFNNMELGILQIAIAMVLMCLLGGCASTKSESVFYGETPYTLETDTIKRLQKIFRFRSGSNYDCCI